MSLTNSSPVSVLLICKPNPKFGQLERVVFTWWSVVFFFELSGRNLYITTQWLLLSDVNDCSDAPCRNGADCFDQLGDYVCVCKSGFQGKNCEMSTSLRDVSDVFFFRQTTWRIFFRKTTVWPSWTKRPLVFLSFPFFAQSGARQTRDCVSKDNCCFQPIKCSQMYMATWPYFDMGWQYTRQNRQSALPAPMTKPSGLVLLVVVIVVYIPIILEPWPHQTRCAVRIGTQIFFFFFAVGQNWNAVPLWKSATERRTAFGVVTTSVTTNANLTAWRHLVADNYVEN